MRSGSARVRQPFGACPEPAVLGQMQPEPSGVKHLVNALLGAGGGWGVGGCHTRRCYPFFGGTFQANSAEGCYQLHTCRVEST